MYHTNLLSQGDNCRNCLGLLKDKPREQQINEFMKEEKADRQLLVALHELTQGKPFEEIVLMEHQRVHPERARQLYLDIATMHQFGVKVRAGTISRISGIEFNDYREHFSAPLQEIVKVEIDKYTLDYCYKTRHARIAYLVFQQICTDDEFKARQIRRLIEGLDAGYSSDRRALEEMSRGRALAENFSSVHEVRAIYETATKAAPKQAFLYQQWAIFESTHPAGSLLLAEARASQAHELDPGNMTIIHTEAEIDRKRAYDELSLILKESLRRRARARLNAMPSHNRFAASSRCKLLVDEATEIHSTLTDETKPHEGLFFAEKIRDAEDALFKAQQEFSDDADIIQVEARLLTMLGQDERALKALERAWASGPRGSRTAIRIAKVYEERDRFADALKILKEALARDTDDKAVHQAIALHYLSQNDYDASAVEHHLRKSFSSEDHNFEERYMLAQFLFLRGDVSGAVALFEIISRRAPSSFRRTVPQKDNAVTKRLPRYTGSIEALNGHFFFIRSGIYPNSIFGHHSSSEPEVSEQLSIGQEVNFRIRFNRAGPAAVDVRAGRNMAH